jgi:cysteinyl-tRNA synthetase
MERPRTPPMNTFSGFSQQPQEAGRRVLQASPQLVAGQVGETNFDYLRQHGNETISKDDLNILSAHLTIFISDVLGLKIGTANSDSKLSPVMDLVLELRQQARENKDWTTSDKIRDGLAAAGIVVKDTKEGTSWS